MVEFTFQLVDDDFLLVEGLNKKGHFLVGFGMIFFEVGDLILFGLDDVLDFEEVHLEFLKLFGGVFDKSFVLVLKLFSIIMGILTSVCNLLFLKHNSSHCLCVFDGSPPYSSTASSHSAFIRYFSIILPP